ncbi:excalibur calcium-binding domain-containing protein [Kangiella sp.]|uniref:excalibur calcium-binding domain-containing protein n=1 Tax=Kangiella sp. TaxID=1920245 RepID=UPI0019971456|nr:excalibur calcium-binding domain-containing protein [Kangiella sp.]MBD3654381.1 excalibur calcium-binding domain-containing protein [Kangiella sp.]
MVINKLILLLIFVLCLPEVSIAKTCKEYRSCAEVIADYPSGNFGRRDGDKDGIPCENVCRSRQQVEDLLKKVSDSNKSKKPSDLK